MTPSVAEILKEHVTLELESIDRLYLNGYVPGLQTPGAVAHFLRKHRGAKFASSVLLDEISRDFTGRIERFVREHGIVVHRFAKGERKDEETQRRLRTFTRPEGVLYLGTAQEKFTTVRTEKRRHPATGQTYPWLVRASVLAKVYYWYIVDEDFGPLFIKFGSYFPYPVKVCLDGHEFLLRQLAKAGVAHESLDNGLRSCADAARAQRLAAGLDERAIAGVFAKWIARLPHPFPAADRAAGYDYNLSILQAEFALTQLFERPLTGRQFFEQIIKDNVTLGHPSQLQLIFERRIMKTTPGRFRTRIITDGVIPSLHLDYKNSRLKQYHKLGRALRTETTINDTRDFGLGRALGNLARLRKIGFGANRRLLGVQIAARDALQSEAAFRRVHEPLVTPQGQKIAGLRFRRFARASTAPSAHRVIGPAGKLSRAALARDSRPSRPTASLRWLISSRQDHLRSAPAAAAWAHRARAAQAAVSRDRGRTAHGAVLHPCLRSRDRAGLRRLRCPHHSRTHRTAPRARTR